MIIIKTKEEIKVIREGGKILANILDKITKEVKPGIDTGCLEEMACSLIKKAGGRPSFKGYKAHKGAKIFPTALCTSINNEIVHAPALPARELKEGDIVGIDVGMEYPISVLTGRNLLEPKQDRPLNKRSRLGGYYTDMSITVPVGKISSEARKLSDTTRECLNLAIKQVKPDNTLRDIGQAIQEHAEARGFSVVRDLVGHGVGVAVHEEPSVFNYAAGSDSHNVKLKSGMVIAIEPMVNAGVWQIKTGADGLTFQTADGLLSAHFEHTIAVIENGHEVLTRM